MPIIQWHRIAHLEELAESEIVEAVGAVEDDALLSHGFGQILGGFGLAGSRGTLRSASKMKMQRSK